MALTTVACVDEPMSPMLDGTTLGEQPIPGRVFRQISQDELHRLERESELGYPSTGSPGFGQGLGDHDNEMVRLAPDASVPDSITRSARELPHARSAPSAVARSLDIPEVCHRDSPALDFDSGWIFFDDDCDALLAAKDQLRGTVALNWDTATVMTDWEGVILGTFGVERLYLHFRGLDGSIPPELGALDNLDVLSLGRNELTGEIPPELGSMRSLERLYLHDNQLTGGIPPEIGRMRSLERLYLWSNQLTGEIPAELGSLSQLERLQLAGNQFTGEIPPELGRLSRLVWLFLQRNQLTGPIPDELGRLTRIERLSLSRNQLTGDIPLELGRLRYLGYLWLYQNELTGSVPRPATGAWQQLRVLWLHDNQLTGEVPADLQNTDLYSLAVSTNDGLTGPLPLELQMLLLDAFYWGTTGLCSPPDPSFQAWLESIDEESYSGGPVCDSGGGGGDRDVLATLYNTMDGPNWIDNNNWLTDAPIDDWYGVDTNDAGRVVQLDLSGEWDLDTQQCVVHGLSGPIPPELGSLSSLRYLRLTCNRLAGELPPELGSLESLVELSLNRNRLTGVIPPELGHLERLVKLSLNGNLLAGEIPPELGSLESLQSLYLSSNDLEGKIPPELGSLTNLERLLLDANNLRGELPPELGNLTNLESLYLDSNELTGAIPDNFLNLSDLNWLLFDENDGLCAPNTNAFTSWLRGIGIWRGSRCEDVDDHKVLQGLTITTSGALKWGNFTNSGCIGAARVTINGTVYEVHWTEWQRRTDGSGWAQVSGTRKTGQICGYNLSNAAAGTYRWVGEMTVAGTRGKYKSENEVTVGGGSNRSPVTVGSISDKTVKEGESEGVNASSYFSDPDGDALTYTASSSNTGVATASVSGRTVTVSGVAEGSATVRIRATDPGGLSATQTFSVTVEAGSAAAPDLVVQSPAVDDDAPDAGASFTFSATVRNRGEGQSGSTTLRYYRSSNATISSSDTEVGTDRVGSLRSGGSSAETVALTAPSQEGAYYFGACVDSVDGESNTDNNCSDGVEVEVAGGGTGREGECVQGATYGRGESCDVYGTGSSSKLTFTVLSDGRARLGFITAGNGITMTGTINGVKYHFVASHQGGGVWKVDEYVP